MTSPQLVLLDLDGTLYEEGVLVPGATDAVKRMRADGHTLRFLTNTDSRATSGLIARVRGYGFTLDPGELFTPVVAAREALNQAGRSRALVLASPEVTQELGEVTDLLPQSRADQATHVIIGDCRESLSSDLIDAAFRGARAGAVLLALQAGRYFRASDGPHADTGAIVAAVEYAAEAKATVLGKPSPAFLNGAIASAPPEFPPGAIWVVGDDRTTDIAMAQAASMRSVQPRTGKYHDQSQREDLPFPEHIVGSVADLPDLLAEAPSRPV